jgi:NAD(P)H-quinone oxidoreductase subunit I
MKIAAFLPELLRHLFKKPATVDYPFKKLEVPKDFRGTPYLDPAMCIVCKACERDCPAEAIEISDVNPAEKRFRMVIHNDRCIHCAQCVDSCPTAPKAMQMDSLFEIATDSRHKLKAEWIYVRAVLKPKAAAPAAAPATPAAEPKA